MRYRRLHEFPARETFAAAFVAAVLSRVEWAWVVPDDRGMTVEARAGEFKVARYISNLELESARFVELLAHDAAQWVVTELERLGAQERP